MGLEAKKYCMITKEDYHTVFIVILFNGFANNGTQFFGSGPPGVA